MGGVQAVEVWSWSLRFAHRLLVSLQIEECDIFTTSYGNSESIGRSTAALHPFSARTELAEEPTAV